MSDPVRIIQAQPGQIIHLGRVGEDGVTKVQFDISAYVAGNTTYSVILSYATLDKIPIQFETQLVGSAYPYYDWIVTAEVTQYLGEGKAQLSITPQIFVNGHYEDDSSQRALSPWYQTLVTTSVYSELQETGDIQTWMDTLTQQLDEAQSIIDTSTGLSKVQASAHSLDYDEQATAGASWAAVGTSDYPQLNLDFGIPVGKPFVISDGKGSLKDLYAAWDADKSDTMYILNGPGEPENGWLYRQDVRSVPPTDPSIPRADSISNLSTATVDAIKYLTYKTGNVIDYDMKYVGVALTSSQYSVVNTEPAVSDMDPGLIYFYKHSGNTYYTAYQKRVLNNTESIKEIVGYFIKGSAPSGNIVYWNNTRYMYGWMYITDLSIAVGVGVESIELYVDANNVIRGRWRDSGNTPHNIIINVDAITNAVITATNAADTATNKASAAADSASDAADSASAASDSAGSASTSAGTATTQALKAEGYAVGTQDEHEQTSGQPYYHDNAKWYKEQANNAAIAANEYKGQAQNAASAANTYAGNALNAWQNLANADAQASTVDSSQSASVTITDVGSGTAAHKRFNFTIPRGIPLEIVGQVSTTSALPSNLQPSQAGLCYGVGTTPPLALYAWTGDETQYTNGWINLGSVGTATNLSLGQSYGESNEATNVNAKTAAITGYQLSDGGIIAIKFAAAANSGFTLNINSTGAKSVALPTGFTSIPAGDVATFIYSQSQDKFIYLGVNEDFANYMKKGVDRVTAGKKSNTTLGNYATAEGSQTTASGNYSHAEGYQTTASYQHAHAEGYITTASMSAAHAEGSNTTASNSSAHAEGTYTTASGTYSHAEGERTTASGPMSHAEGKYTTAQRRSQHVFGEYNILDTEGNGTNVKGNYIEIVGNGTADDVRLNARTLDWSGNEWLAGTLKIGGTSYSDTNAKTVATTDQIPSLSNYMQKGVDYVTAGKVGSSTLGTKATVEGKSNIANGAYSHSEGSGNWSNGQYSHAEGYHSVAYGQGSHAEGYSDTTSGTVQVTGDANATSYTFTNASPAYNLHKGTLIYKTPLPAGQNPSIITNVTFTSANAGTLTVNQTLSSSSVSGTSVVYESNSIAYGVGAHAEGTNTIAYGNSSHTEGTYSEALGSNDHAEGYNTIATGGSSHAEGSNTTASGQYSHAEGGSTEANGDYSHVEGLGTIANGDIQHVSGKYNISDTTSLEIIGNGTGSSNRSNARTLDSSGNERLAGSITLGMNTANETTLTAAELAALKSPTGTYNTSSFELTMPFTINVVNS